MHKSINEVLETQREKSVLPTEASARKAGDKTEGVEPSLPLSGTKGFEVKASRAGASAKTKSSAKKKTRRSGDRTAGRTLKKASGEHNKELGRRGEDAAARFLERRGYELVQRNWVCPAGEADIIARDDDTLVFVEVKTRSDIQKGLPAEAVDAQKRKRYECIAALFLQHYEVVDIPVRFDVISLVTVAPDRALVRHHINAFTAG